MPIIEQTRCDGIIAWDLANCIKKSCAKTRDSRYLPSFLLLSCRYESCLFVDPGSWCDDTSQTRTEFTPRAYPSFTNIRTLMLPEMLAHINDPLPNIYSPPDVFNPSLHPPEEDVDVLSIVEAGVPFSLILAPTYAQSAYAKPKFSKPPHVPVGKGVVWDTKSGDAFCDGSLHSFCSRGEDSSCLLSGHNDGRIRQFQWMDCHEYSRSIAWIHHCEIGNLASIRKCLENRGLAQYQQ